MDNNQKEVLDSLCVRFLLGVQSNLNTERLFFILEEAHWFLLDNFEAGNAVGQEGVSLYDFCNIMLLHCKIPINLKMAYSKFMKYRQSIKVYGAILINRQMTKVLIVKEGIKSKNYSFPKGKKNKDESGMECAVREVYEETGYDISNKICNIEVNVFGKLTFYFVFNVSEEFKFESKMKNEIEKIEWMPIKILLRNNLPREFIVVSTALKKGWWMLEEVKENRFKINKKRIIEVMDSALIK